MSPPITESEMKTAESGEGKSDKHVYFILEKQDDLESSSEGPRVLASGSSHPNFKGRTLARANVSVAARARMFEDTLLDPSQLMTKNSAAQSADESADPLYEVPPALQAEADKASQPVTTAHPPGQRDDADIYEITFEEQLNQADTLQSCGSMESSGAYEEVQQPTKPGTWTGVYELAKPLALVQKTDVLRRSMGSELNSSGGFLPCLQGTARVGQAPGVVPSQEEIESEYNRLNFTRQDKARSTPEAAYHSLDTGELLGECCTFFLINSLSDFHL